MNLVYISILILILSDHHYGTLYKSYEYLIIYILSRIEKMPNKYKYLILYTPNILLGNTF